MNRTDPILAAELDPEAAVCGSLREPFTFWMWRRVAGSPDPRRLAGVKDIEPLRFKTRDGIALGGFKLKSANPIGYLLVAQGNAMLADQLVAELAQFRERGMDVYIFDYRGYGSSEGKSRLAAIVADYAEIVADLNLREYRKRLLYGISMGGVILLNAAGSRPVYDRLVVDSSPGRIANLGCPERYDPIAHLPEDGARLMVISGARDNVVTPAQMAELIQVADSRGARILRDESFAHPFQDNSALIHRRRQNEIMNFLLRD